MTKKTTKIIEKKTVNIEITKEILLELAKQKGYSGESLYELENWIRKKFGLHAEIFYSMFHKKFSINNYFIDLFHGKKIEWDYKSINYESYDNALIIALYNMLNLV